MTLFKRLQRVAVVVWLLAGIAAAQEDPSHRKLDDAGLDFNQFQLRLELLQRLQQIAKDRQERGQPPFNPEKLPPQIRQQLDRVLQQDKQLKNKIQRENDRQNGRDQSPQAAAQPANGTGQQSPTGQPPRQGTERPPTNGRQPQPGQNNRRPPNGNNPADNANGNNRTANGDNDQTPQQRQSLRDLLSRLTGNGTRDNQGNGSQQGGSNSPSQRTLSQDDIDDFDIGKYLERLQDLPPIPNNGSNPRAGNNRGNNARQPRNRSSPGRANQPRTGNDESRKTLPANSAKTYKKLWESITKSGPNPPPNSEPDSTTPSDNTAPAGSPDSAAGPGPSTTGGEGFFADAMRKTAESMIDEIGDIVKNRKARSRSQPRQRSGGLLKGISEKTGQFFQNSTGRNNVGGGGGGSRTQLPSPPSGSSVLVFLVVLLLIGGGWFLVQNYSGSAAMVPALAGVTPATMPRGIHSRQDVIDAFHVIATESPAVKGNWWTHSRAARALRKLMPQRNDDLSNLMRVYETARYLPPDTELTADQLQVAREAISRCAK